MKCSFLHALPPPGHLPPATWLGSHSLIVRHPLSTVWGNVGPSDYQGAEKNISCKIGGKHISEHFTIRRATRNRNLPLGTASPEHKEQARPRHGDVRSKARSDDMPRAYDPHRSSPSILHDSTVRMACGTDVQGKTARVKHVYLHYIRTCVSAGAGRRSGGRP